MVYHVKIRINKLKNKSNNYLNVKTFTNIFVSWKIKFIFVKNYTCNEILTNLNDPDENSFNVITYIKYFLLFPNYFYCPIVNVIKKSTKIVYKN